MIERVIIRPVEGGDPLTLVIVTLGLFILVNSARRLDLGLQQPRRSRALFPRRQRSTSRGVSIVVRVARASSPCCSSSSACSTCSSSSTKLGLAMRAVGVEPGVDAGWSASASGAC